MSRAVSVSPKASAASRTRTRSQAVTPVQGSQHGSLHGGRRTGGAHLELLLVLLAHVLHDAHVGLHTRGHHLDHALLPLRTPARDLALPVSVVVEGGTLHRLDLVRVKVRVKVGARVGRVREGGVVGS